MIDRDQFVQRTKDLRNYIDGLDQFGRAINSPYFTDALYESFLGDMIGTFGMLLIQSITPNSYTQKQLDYFSECYFNIVHDKSSKDEDLESLYDNIMIGEIDESWSQMYDQWN